MGMIDVVLVLVWLILGHRLQLIITTTNHLSMSIYIVNK